MPTRFNDAEIVMSVLVRSSAYTISMWTCGVAVILPIGGTVALQCV